MRPAIFLDRDGVIIKDVHHLHHPEQVHLIAGVGPAIKQLKEAGYWVIVLTNQSVIARGLLTEKDLVAVHKIMLDKLAETGGKIDAIYYCPHHPTVGESGYTRICDCRKPAGGLAVRAQRDFSVDMESSWVIGDKISDMEMGSRLGLRRILVLTGYGKAQMETILARFPDTIVAADIGNAAEVIIRESELG